MKQWEAIKYEILNDIANKYVKMNLKFCKNKFWNNVFFILILILRIAEWPVPEWLKSALLRKLSIKIFNFEKKINLHKSKDWNSIDF